MIINLIKNKEVIDISKDFQEVLEVLYPKTVLSYDYTGYENIK